MAGSEIGRQMRTFLSATKGPGEAPKSAKPATRKQTSAKVSKLAARLVKLTEKDIATLTAGGLKLFVADIRTLAISCLSQDEVNRAKPKKVKA